MTIAVAMGRYCFPVLIPVAWPENTAEKRQRFLNEINAFKSRWQKELDAGDPYYNVNLRLDASPFKRER